MSKKDINFDYITDRTIVVYIHGYRGDKDELPFLRNFIIKKKKFSFFSFSYKLQKSSGGNYTIQKIISNIKKVINRFLNKHHFDKCYIIGYSLGAAIAVEIVARKLIKCDGLILISVFDNRKDLLKSRKIDIREEENIIPVISIKRIKKTYALFIHGISDKSIDLERGKRVFNNSYKKNSKFIKLNIDHYFKNFHSKKLLLEAIDSFLSCQ